MTVLIVTLCGRTFSQVTARAPASPTSGSALRIVGRWTGCRLRPLYGGAPGRGDATIGPSWSKSNKAVGSVSDSLYAVRYTPKKRDNPSNVSSVVSSPLRHGPTRPNTAVYRIRHGGHTGSALVQKSSYCTGAPHQTVQTVSLIWLEVVRSVSIAHIDAAEPAELRLAFLISTSIKNY